MKHKVATLELISRTGEPAAIPDLANFLLHRNREVAQTAVAAVNALGRCMNLSDFPWLDRVMRERSPYRWTYPSAWAELKPVQLSRLHEFGPFVLGMATLHFNGYVREQALRLLATVKNGEEVPFLLLRVNDWVAEICDAAQHLIEERLTSKYASFFVKSLPLLNRVQYGHRGHAREVVVAIIGLLKKEGQAVVMGLDSGDPETRRSCYRLAFQCNNVDKGLIVQRALSESDPAIRLCGIQNLASISERSPAERLLSRARADRFAPVRREAIRVSAHIFPEAAVPWIKDALLDRHPAVRSYAQFLMGQHSKLNLKQFYLDALTRPDSGKLCAAISGLGEAGTASDAECVVAYVSHPRARIRRAVIRTLARLRAGDFIALFEERLSDPAPSVSREAMKGLCRNVPLLGGVRLWEIFTSTTVIHTRRNALFLIARFSKWESISYLIQALCTDDSGLRELAECYVRRWNCQFNRSFTSPTRAQVERLSNALEKCGSRLTPTVRELLEATSRSVLH